MKVCKSCLMPDTRPRISFTGEVCNACIHAANKQLHTSINYESRGEELNNLLTRIKHKKPEYGYHCIVPWSGGKDSSSIAMKIKYDYNLNPLLINFNPLIPTNVGNHNRNIMLKAGFDSIEIKNNQKVSRHLSKRFFIERGNPKLHWDAGINASIYRAAIAYKIPFIFYAEHGETNYGGRILEKTSEQIRSYEEIIENQIGDDPENWVEENTISLNDLSPYIVPSPDEMKKANIEAHYFGYYKHWNVNENYRYIADKLDFKTNARGRTYGTLTDYDSLDDHIDDLYYYMQFIKFGFGRAIRDLSRQIQNLEISRIEALELAKKYDGEYPEETIDVICEYLEVDESELHRIIDSHRNSVVWERIDGKWINKVHNLLF